MNRLLLIAWCVELTSEHFLTLGSPTEFSLSSSSPKGLDLKWPSIKTVGLQSSRIVAEPTTSKSEREAKKVVKNEYGYSISEVYDSQTQKNVSDSTKKPLSFHKSGSLTTQVPSPFKSSWTFPPSDKGLVEKRGSQSHGLALTDSSFPSTNFSSKFSDFGILNKTNNLNKLNNSFGALGNSSFLSNMPLFDKLELFNDVPSSLTSTSTEAQPLTQKSFFGYNIKEVTSNGKTQGTVEIFGNDGVEKNVQYNELSKPSNITKASPMMKKTTVRPPVTAKTQSSPPKLTTTKPVVASTTVRPAADSATKAQSLAGTTTAAGPRHIIIEDVRPFTPELAHDQPIASEFATPEFILYDFLGQLQTFPYIPAENFDENRRTTYDELVSQNTFVYTKR